MVALMLLSTSFLIAQDKLVIKDRIQFLTEGTEMLLQERLVADSLVIASMVDTRRLCEYWFMSLLKEGDELVMQILDCEDKPVGSRNLGSRIFSATDQEKTLLLYFALTEIIKNPYREMKEAVAPTPEPAAQAVVIEGKNVEPVVNPEQHKSRYFFAPSSLNLEKGELYYNSLYFLVHDVQYGVSEKFSMGMGTTVSGFPFYLTPKLTIPVNDKSAFAIGDLMMLGTWGADFFGNLFYGTYTHGNAYSNITFGLGHLYVGTGDLTMNTHAPVLNFSGLGKLSDHIFFITENYISQVKTKQMALYNYFNEGTQVWVYREETFSQKMFFIYGMTGFRFINKTKDVISWQIGLTYVYTGAEEIPGLYKTSYWTTDAQEGSGFIAFPVIGYARKFSTRF